VSTIPDDAQLISIEQNGTAICISHAQGGILSSAHISDIRVAVTPCNPLTSVSKSYFLYQIRLHNGIIVSDGSYKDSKATFAFLAQPIKHSCSFRALDWDSLLYSAGHVDDSDEDTNAYRAELAGILAAITFTNSLCHEANVHDGTCTLYCDNKGALAASFGHKRPHPSWSSYDLVWKIRRALLRSQIVWRFKHVYGHQDKLATFQSLDFIAQGNVIVDHLATHYDLGHSSYGNQLWTPIIQGTVIGGSVEKQLTHMIHRPLMIDRWTSLFHFSQRNCNPDWELFFKSLCAQKNNYSHFGPNIIQESYR
jgi:hypothetical protein